MANIIPFDQIMAQIRATMNMTTVGALPALRKRTSKAYLAQVVDDLSGDIQRAVRYLIGQGRKGNEARLSKKDRCINMLVERKMMTFEEIALEFRYGESDMRMVMKAAIRERRPEKRVWIDYKNDTYIVIAQGEQPPEGWIGYMTIEKSIKNELNFDDMKMNILNYQPSGNNMTEIKGSE
jgi:hypothetical protein